MDTNLARVVIEVPPNEGRRAGNGHKKKKEKKKENELVG
jgi:hypothetical protein